MIAEGIIQGDDVAALTHDDFGLSGSLVKRCRKPKLDIGILIDIVDGSIRIDTIINVERNKFEGPGWGRVIN